MWTAAAARLTEQQIDGLEQKFVEDIWHLLGSAHYRLLSQDEWVTALKEDFTVNNFDAIHTLVRALSQIHLSMLDHLSEQGQRCPMLFAM